MTDQRTDNGPPADGEVNDRRVPPARRVGEIALAVGFVALAAQVDVGVPGSPVPQSLQTFAVVLVGAALGARWGAAALMVYVLLGAAGLPVFAGGEAGWRHLGGPTSGYLVGFVVGAAIAGWWCAQGEPRGFGRLLVGMVAAHAVILGLGWGRLALLLGPTDAWAQGVAPFLWGGAVKAVAAAGLVWGVRRKEAASRTGLPG